jgi:glutaconate CoA-transferase subunit B
VIGGYERPKVRLPGGGGAPEIAGSCGQVYVVMAQSRRSFVEKVDFITSFGHGDGGDHRQRLGLRTAGPTLAITDLCIMKPDPETKELTVVALHPGVTREQVQANTGWALRFADSVAETPAPSDQELAVLRDLQGRTARTHGTAA